MKNLYEKAVELLCSQGKFYINLGLDRTLKILDCIGNPQNNLRFIHVAGTNGKGSVCSMLNNILLKSDYKVGLYTSPHLVNYTERIKINNVEISQEDFAKSVFEINEICEKENINLTEFEILTVSAFRYFAQNNVDVVILETGMGGRFDATNVISSPIVSIITSISLDHVDRLGNTIEKIAFEKSGIIKENSIVVTSCDNNGLNVIKQVAQEKNSKLFLAKNKEIKFENGINFLKLNNEKLEFSLLGLYQAQNVGLVIETVERLREKGFNITFCSLKEGLRTTKWAARLEYRKDKNLLIDGAHNPDAALELAKSLEYYFKNQKRIFIYSTINTKDFSQIAKILFNDNDEIYYLDFSYAHAVKYQDFCDKLPNLKKIKNIDKSQLQEVLQRKELKILTGSLYMIGEVYDLL